MRARSPRLALATVAAEGLLGRLTFGMVSFGLPLYAHSLGMSMSQIGFLISIRTVFVLPFKPVAGWLADRIGIRAVYLAGIAARTLSAVVLLSAGDFLGLVLVRMLQAGSAAGRDVASLSVIARDGGGKVGTHYGWYASAKQVGGVTGAGAAGIVLGASGYRMLFLVVLAMSLVPLAIAWIGLRETGVPDAPSREQRPRQSVRAGLHATFDGLGGAASVGMLVAASAYMVHGIFPILATEYAGLSAAQAGVIYSISAAVFLVAGPFFGWLIDRRGRKIGLALRSLCNIGSSALYIAFPSFAGLTVARCVDDSGKAAFRPAWASLVAEIAADDPERRGRRLGALDTSASVGEVVGPALAGILWQTGGIVPLFAARIAIAIVAEVAALRVFGDLPGFRLPLRTGSAPRLPAQPAESP